MKLISFLSALILLFSCHQKRLENTYLGTVNLHVSGNNTALPYFEKGLLLLHSFEYSDAREEFLKAQEADPKMGMAYWGEAMTYNHAIWHEQDYEKGRLTLQKLKLMDSLKLDSELEKEFINAVEILYQADLSKNERDQNYADYMERLYKKYPESHEIAAFYALALLGSVSDGRDDNIYGHGAIVAKSILAQNPKHPGALHYLIHSYDDPDHARLALDAADSYSKVAPDASHALHMPSHIYVALGMWDEVVASNEHSYQASLNRMERKKLDNDERGYHAFHWLEYGYLQQDRTEDARKLVLDMEKYSKETPSKRVRAHMVYLKGTFLVETNLWNDPIADIEVVVSDLNISERTQYNFIEGMKTYSKGEKEKLDEIIEMIRFDYEKEALFVVESGITVCSNLTSQVATQSNIDESKTMEFQLRGLRAWMDNDSETTERWLKKSIELEDALSYSFGPPVIQKPTRELYAEWLLENNRPDEALYQFEQTLKRAPKRMLALKGKDKAENQISSVSMHQEDKLTKKEPV